MSHLSPHDYGGDIDVLHAWDILNKDQHAQLVDVRTIAEWSFVGVPDLSGLDRAAHCIEWQQFPSMGTNRNFVAEAGTAVQEAGAGFATPILFLCRSGTRSKAAAIAMAQAGFAQAFNVAGGFEGDLDGERHRGQRNGWKAAGLPWKQS